MAPLVFGKSLKIARSFVPIESNQVSGTKTILIPILLRLGIGTRDAIAKVLSHFMILRFKRLFNAEN